MTQQFHATLIQGGITTTPSVTWSVVGGPGTIDSSGNYVSSQGGAAVIEADAAGTVARAGVIVSNGIPQQTLSLNGRGLVNAATVSWSPPAVQPAAYELTVQALSPVPPGAGTSMEAIAVSNPKATHAYLPGLAAGVTYSVTATMIYPIGLAGIGPTSLPTAVTPLDALPTMLGGSGTDRDAAVDATGKPDDTGRASDGGAVISRDGSYGFYYTQADSNLAPPAIANPASDDVYLVRENLVTG